MVVPGWGIGAFDAQALAEFGGQQGLFQRRADAEQAPVRDLTAIENNTSEAADIRKDAA